MIFEMAGKEEWSVDLCSQFANYADYQRQALGVAILYQGELVAGASPYSVYDGGIEIEIDTKPEYRQQGLATVCGAKLILECLERNLYPSWAAHDPVSYTHLAEIISEAAPATTIASFSSPAVEDESASVVASATILPFEITIIRSQGAEISDNT